MVENLIVDIGIKLTTLDALIVRHKCKGDMVYVAISNDGRTDEEVQSVARQVKVILMAGFMQAGMDVSNFRMFYKSLPRSEMRALLDKRYNA